MQHLFVSYPREYRPVVERLVAQLRSSGYDLFFDEQLAGGQRWWDELLNRIEQATIFVPIIGSSYLASTPCRLEAEYANALAKPFLPIAIEPVPAQLFSEVIATAHWSEYDLGKPESVFAVIRGINGLPPAPPLPATMPPRPPVPISYMTELQNELGRDEEIGRARQLAIIADLRGRLNGPDHDAVVVLLRHFRQRPEIGYQAAIEIDELLAKMPPAAASPQAQPQPPSPQVPQARPAQPEPRPATTPPAARLPPQGQPVSGPQPAPPARADAGWYQAPPAKPDNYYLWTILSCVLCCIPLGIVGIYYSYRVDELWAAGKYAEAVDASNKAKLWAIISVVVGVLFISFLLSLSSA